MTNLCFKSYTKENWEDALKLKVNKNQKEFCPTIAESLAAAFIKPWDEALDPYLIYLDDLMIGAFYVSYTPNSIDNYWLGGFMIDKNHQNKGYGNKALIEILKFVPKIHPNCKQINLTVEKENKIAQKLYQSLGFEDTSQVNKYGEIIYTLPVFTK